MKKYKILAVIMACLLVMGLFAGCGANSMAATDSAAPMDKNESANMDVVYDDVAEEAITGEGGTVSDDMAALPENMMFITTWHMNVETENMEALLKGVNQKITELGGYIENQEIYNGSSYDSYRYRNAYLTARIPAEKLNSFVAAVGEQANVISQNESKDNVTLTYVATESRLKALQTEEERLLELLAMAETMEDLLLIEARLTEVRAELEQVTSALRTLSNQINYSTVHLDIREVKEYTDTQEPETVWDRISKGFADSMENMGEGLVDFFVFIIVAIPYLIPFGVVAVVIVLIVLAANRKKKKKNLPPEQPKE